jgi:hypothetical protein
MGDSKGFPTSHHKQDSNIFCKSYDVFFYSFQMRGMVLATAIATESAQNSRKQPNFVKICPKTISLRNFEIPPKIKILVFFKK